MGEQHLAGRLGERVAAAVVEHANDQQCGERQRRRGGPERGKAERRHRRQQRKRRGDPEAPDDAGGEHGLGDDGDDVYREIDARQKGPAQRAVGDRLAHQMRLDEVEDRRGEGHQQDPQRDVAQLRRAEYRNHAAPGAAADRRRGFAVQRSRRIVGAPGDGAGEPGGGFERQHGGEQEQEHGNVRRQNGGACRPGDSAQR